MDQSVVCTVLPAILIVRRVARVFVGGYAKAGDLASGGSGLTSIGVPRETPTLARLIGAVTVS